MDIVVIKSAVSRIVSNLEASKKKLIGDELRERCIISRHQLDGAQMVAESLAMHSEGDLRKQADDMYWQILNEKIDIDFFLQKMSRTN